MDLVSDASLSGAKPVDTPMVKSSHGLTNEGVLFKDPEKFRRLIGRLLYLGFTKPDIAYATQSLSQFMQQPCEHHWEAALHSDTSFDILKDVLHVGYSSHLITI